MLEIILLLAFASILNLFPGLFGLNENMLAITNVMVAMGLGVPLIFHLRHLNAPFVPTGQQASQIMLRLAYIKHTDTVYELWCGDGRLIHKAAQMWAKKAVGYELSFLLVIYARLIGKWSWSAARIYRTDFWKKDFQDADVILCFLSLSAMQKVEDTIWPQLPKGARLVSNAFPFPRLPIEKQENGVYLYLKQ